MGEKDTAGALHTDETYFLKPTDGYDISITEELALIGETMDSILAKYEAETPTVDTLVNAVKSRPGDRTKAITTIIKRISKIDADKKKIHDFHRDKREIYGRYFKQYKQCKQNLQKGKFENSKKNMIETRKDLLSEKIKALDKEMKDLENKDEKYETRRMKLKEALRELHHRQDDCHDAFIEENMPEP